MRLVYNELRGYKYRVASPFYVDLPEHLGLKVESTWILLDHERLSIRSGYAWDGASGPTLDTKSTIKASLVHDALCQLIRGGYLPPSLLFKVNLCFFQFMREDGLSNARSKLACGWAVIRATYYFLAVQAFTFYIHPKKIEDQDITHEV